MSILTSSGWDHGFYTNSTDTCGFYRETAANWLNFAALFKGYPSPRWQEGAASAIWIQAAALEAIETSASADLSWIRNYAEL